MLIYVHVSRNMYCNFIPVSLQFVDAVQFQSSVYTMVAQKYNRRLSRYTWWNKVKLTAKKFNSFCFAFKSWDMASKHLSICCFSFLSVSSSSLVLSRSFTVAASLPYKQSETIPFYTVLKIITAKYLYNMSMRELVETSGYNGSHFFTQYIGSFWFLDSTAEHCKYV